MVVCCVHACVRACVRDWFRGEFRKIVVIRDEKGKIIMIFFESVSVHLIENAV